MSSTTRSLINALRVLDSEIQSEDGAANAAVAEAATRLEEQQEHIHRLEKAGDELMRWRADPYSVALWNQAKGTKP